MPDFIPRPDGTFDAWAWQYYTTLKAWWDAQGLDLARLANLADALEAWQAAYPAHVAAQNAAEAARRTKDAARRALEREARPVAAFVQSYPETTNADRATMGITVHAPRAGAAPAPTTRPLLIVDDGGRLTHRLRLVDEATPTRRARPRGVERAEVFVAFTPAKAPTPASLDAYRYVGSVGDGATVLRFEDDRGGMQAHYLARWVTRRGAIGPWSDGATATVAA